MRQDDRVILSISGTEHEIHQVINQQRQKYGLAKLSFDAKLSEIAREHSKDMAKRNFFSHESPEGKTPTNRGAIAGYKCRKNYGNYYTEGLAENIFKSHLYKSIVYYNGVPSYDWMIQSEIAQSTVSGWMSSPGHRKNILTATYNKEGIGVAISLERNEIYVTQNFC
ncbi:MAG: CAP domain-containing protein [Microcoleus sp.]